MQPLPDLQFNQQSSAEAEAKLVAVSHSLFRYNLFSVLRLPPIEAVMEILVTKADPSAALMLKEEPLCVIADMANLLSGFTISFLEFS